VGEPPSQGARDRSFGRGASRRTLRHAAGGSARHPVKGAGAGAVESMEVRGADCRRRRLARSHATPDPAGWLVMGERSAEDSGAAGDFASRVERSPERCMCG